MNMYIDTIKKYIIKKTNGWDIFSINLLESVKKISIPALFLYSEEDV